MNACVFVTVDRGISHYVAQQGNGGRKAGLFWGRITSMEIFLQVFLKAFRHELCREAKIIPPTSLLIGGALAICVLVN
jgi:hypothetical protein